MLPPLRSTSRLPAEARTLAGPPLALRLKGFKIHCDRTDTSYWSVYESGILGTYNPLLNELLRSDIVADVGANVGTFSLLASRHAGKVIAVEPHPRTFELLCRNIAENGAANVIPLNLAVTAEVGFVRIGGSGLSAKIEDSGQLVAAQTLRSLLSPGVTAMKMDIEGQETRVLAEPDLLRGVRSVAIETHDSLHVIESLLLSAGFSTSVHNAQVPPLGKMIASEFISNELETRFATLRLLLAAAREHGPLLRNGLFNSSVVTVYGNRGHAL
jgi:FkbM family methyltransferase